MSVLREFDKFDAAYIAGLIDGIGDIDFTFGHIDPRRPESGRTYIQVSNSYRPVLEWLKFLVGGKIYDKPSKGPPPKMNHFLRITSTATFMLLNRILPYLKIERERADDLLKCKPLITKKGHRTEAEKKKLRHLSKRMHDLKVLIGKTTVAQVSVPHRRTGD
jgi:hypothetical protein